MAKSKQAKVDRWVSKYLEETENSTGLTLDRIPWICPNCGKKYLMVLPINKYIASYKFECNACKIERKHRHLHFYTN